MLKVGQVKGIYEVEGTGRSIRGTADDLGIARNTVRRYLKSPEPVWKPRSPAAEAPISRLRYVGLQSHRIFAARVSSGHT